MPLSRTTRGILGDWLTGSCPWGGSLGQIAGHPTGSFFPKTLIAAGHQPDCGWP